ncbi:pyrroline-5-carboxylate reductase [Paenibacillus psychroresistens]|uniref:Pyrroline-5-carboxylate reductase n=1 Tax=Paenibacillus psychroresistens TaxID=1778678 RepID=A0A6B8RM44_9BACL|nr:pyrroline-5-carboxylate reductase [Paenibacillus psychroresistens]QGQ96824.1 pyrroline-5-carboxylate reductase [Paenibacillus psychroresistens]
MPLILATKKIIFIGAGSMAEAIISGLLQKDKINPTQILALNRSNHVKLAQLQSQYDIQVGSIGELTNETLQAADIVVLAMKPKDAAQAIIQLKTKLHNKQLLISLIAGLSIQTIEALLGTSFPIARTMPNTSSSIGLGSTGLSFSASVESSQQGLATEIFASVGEVFVIEESQIDILTGVSGCGPAYVYYLMEAMISGGIQGGLSPEMARDLTVQTVLGAASMVKATQTDPAILRKNVTSPNGATQAALETMDHFHFTEGVEKAVLRASERANELGAMIAADAIKLN